MLSLTYLAEVLAVARFMPVAGTFVNGSEGPSVEGTGERMKKAEERD
jgi:hypothetical protein